MATAWDLAAYNREQRLLLLVEVKVKLGVSKDWAQQWWQTLFAEHDYPEAPYFLLAFPDRFFLWKKAVVVDSSEEKWSFYQIEALPILKPYFEAVALHPESLSASSFELLIGSWLNRLTQIEPQQEIFQEQCLLLESGLWPALLGGSVCYGVEA